MPSKDVVGESMYRIVCSPLLLWFPSWFWGFIVCHTYKLKWEKVKMYVLSLWKKKLCILNWKNNNKECWQRRVVYWGFDWASDYSKFVVLQKKNLDDLVAFYFAVYYFNSLILFLLLMLKVTETLICYWASQLLTCYACDPLAEVVVSPPFVFLTLVKSILRPDFHVAAQNSWVKKGGAFTGEVR